MKTRLMLTTCIVLATSLVASLPVNPVAAADAPADRVVVMYFHRTERCPTCQKMGSYSEEAVKSLSADQTSDQPIKFHYIDFEKKKNEKIVKGYGVEDPALIVAKIKDGKVKKYTNLEDIWEHVADKPAFVKYVQDNIAAYCE